MEALPAVVRAEYVSDYKIRLRFNDGVCAVVDFEEWLEGPVFEPVKDRRYFASFVLEGGTVGWPNGADIAPEALHARAKSIEAA